MYVFSDSVLCLGDRFVEYRSVASWQDKIGWFTQTPEGRELDSLDLEQVVFEWIFSQDTLKLLQEVQSTMEEYHIRPEEFISVAILTQELSRSK